MSVYDLYGATSDDINKAKVELEEALGLKFEARDSFFLGEYFRSGQQYEADFQLRFNLDPLDLEPAEMDFPDYRLLLYVNGTCKENEIFGRLQAGAKEFVFLRRKELKERTPPA